MSFTETNHRLKLASRSCDAFLTRSYILSQFPHLNILLDKFLAGRIGDIGFN
jgi:hypothetical protein